MYSLITENKTSSEIIWCCFWQMQHYNQLDATETLNQMQTSHASHVNWKVAKLKMHCHHRHHQRRIHYQRSCHQKHHLTKPCHQNLSLQVAPYLEVMLSMVQSLGGGGIVKGTIFGGAIVGGTIFGGTIVGGTVIEIIIFGGAIVGGIVHITITGGAVNAPSWGCSKTERWTKGGLPPLRVSLQPRLPSFLSTNSPQRQNNCPLEHVILEVGA